MARGESSIDLEPFRKIIGGEHNNMSESSLI